MTKLMGWGTVLALGLGISSARADFNPLFEGHFRAPVTCTVAGSGNACPIKNHDAAITIINTGSIAGILVSVNSAKFGVQYYEFTARQVDNDGAILAGYSDREDLHHAEFRFNLDFITREISGWIADYDRGYDIRFAGNQTIVPATLYTSSPLEVSNDEMIGNYVGVVNGLKTRLVIQRRVLGENAGSLIATLIHETIGHLGTFPHVQYLPWAGVLELLNVQDDDPGFQKWTLQMTRTSGGAIALKGVGLSTYGSMTANIDFVKAN